MTQKYQKSSFDPLHCVNSIGTSHFTINIRKQMTQIGGTGAPQATFAGVRALRSITKQTNTRSAKKTLNGSSEPYLHSDPLLSIEARFGLLLLAAGRVGLPRLGLGDRPHPGRAPVLHGGGACTAVEFFGDEERAHTRLHGPGGRFVGRRTT